MPYTAKSNGDGTYDITDTKTKSVVAQKVRAQSVSFSSVESHTSSGGVHHNISGPCIVTVDILGLGVVKATLV